MKYNLDDIPVNTPVEELVWVTPEGLALAGRPLDSIEEFRFSPSKKTLLKKIAERIRLLDMQVVSHFPLHIRVRLYGAIDRFERAAKAAGVMASAYGS